MTAGLASASLDAGPASSAAGAASAAAGPPADVGAELLLGPPSYFALSTVGAVAVRRDDELVVRPLEAQHQAEGSPEQALLPVPPTLTEGNPERLYWISKGRLLRKPLGTAGTAVPPETLAKDAADGSIVAALRTHGPSGRDVVVYLGKPEGSEGERPVKLWLDGHEARKLSQDAGNFTSVALAALGAGELVALTFDGRMGMSSLHAVNITVDAAGNPTVGQDRVIYVGGSAERHTRIGAAVVGPAAFGLWPMAKDIRGFGLAVVPVPADSSEPKPVWIDYPNGIDPAPLAFAVICGRPQVAFVRPESGEAGAGHVIELAELRADGTLVRGPTMGQGSRIAQVVLRALPEDAARPPTSAPGAASAARQGGWIGWASEVGILARPIMCAPRGRRP